MASRPNAPCAVPDCPGRTLYVRHPQRGGYLCSAHAYRLKKYGEVFEELPVTTARGPLSTIPERAAHGVDHVPQVRCTVDGCEVRHFGVGLCQAHYSRSLKYGDPVAEVDLGAQDEELVRALAGRTTGGARS